MKTFSISYTETAIYDEEIQADTELEAQDKFLDLLANMKVEPVETVEGRFGRSEEVEEITKINE